MVKGSEFKHVMVVMDDKEAGGNWFSYDKLFGAEELNPTDEENVEDGSETISTELCGFFTSPVAELKRASH